MQGAGGRLKQDAAPANGLADVLGSNGTKTASMEVPSNPGVLSSLGLPLSSGLASSLNLPFGLSTAAGIQACKAAHDKASVISAAQLSNAAAGEGHDAGSTDHAVSGAGLTQLSDAAASEPSSLSNIHVAAVAASLTNRLQPTQAASGEGTHTAPAAAASNAIRDASTNAHAAAATDTIAVTDVLSRAGPDSSSLSKADIDAGTASASNPLQHLPIRARLDAARLTNGLKRRGSGESKAAVPAPSNPTPGMYRADSRSAVADKSKDYEGPFNGLARHRPKKAAAEVQQPNTSSAATDKSSNADMKLDADRSRHADTPGAGLTLHQPNRSAGEPNRSAGEPNRSAGEPKGRGSSPKAAGQADPAAVWKAEVGSPTSRGRGRLLGRSRRGRGGRSFPSKLGQQSLAGHTPQTLTGHVAATPHKP